MRVKVGFSTQTEQCARWKLRFREFQVDFSAKHAELNSVLPRGTNILLALLTGVA